jgi:Leucine-rich repeat (LRR) protein
VTNLNICAKLPLRELWAADCRVEDISPLLNVPLKLVNVSRTKVSDLAPVKHVRTVFADGSQVVSLIGMEPCSIERLSMNECPIKSLEGIESLSRLEDLAFKDTAIKDIWRLKSIQTLKHVSFTNAEGESVNLYRSHTNSPYWGQVFSK